MSQKRRCPDAYGVGPGSACRGYVDPQLPAGVEAGVSTLITNLRSYLDESDSWLSLKDFGSRTWR